MTRARPFAFFAWASLFPLACAAPLAAQQKCPAPPALAKLSAPNIFSPQQEVDLGDVMSEEVEVTEHVIHDDALASHLNHIVAQLLVQLPPAQMQFRVALIDIPDVNAFSLPGGRIYVSRKLVVFARNDDEVAAFLAHEMGHILSHQHGIEVTRAFSAVLGVNSVTDRKDIAEKFNRLKDNIAKNPSEARRIEREEEPDQYQADQVGLYALAAAGYSPQSFAAFFDRLAQTKGKTGSWLSNVLGTTAPDQKRLGLIKKDLADLPAACRDSQPPKDATADFLAWQADVAAYSGLGRPEALSGLLAKKTLDPPLRPDVTNLRFSPDGKYVLAQDDASIFVLSRSPFQLLYRVDAPDSRPAQFSPDSQSVVFNTRSLRVEKWSVPDGARTDVHEIATPTTCVQTQLDSDGSTLACVDSDMGVSLYDVAKGAQVFFRKEYFRPQGISAFNLMLDTFLWAASGVDFQWVHMGFSPDAKTFVASSADDALAIDLASHNPVAMHGDLSHLVRGGFAFLQSGRVIGINQFDPKNSAIVNFPSGETVSKLPLGGDSLTGAAHGDFLVVGPLKEAPIGVLDLSSNRFVFGRKNSLALDAYDHSIVAEEADGKIGIYDIGENKPIAEATISLSPLEHLRARAVSPDLQWIALSGKTRGAVWNLTTGRRTLYVRGFNGAYFDGDQALLADFPKLDKVDRTLVRMGVNGQEPVAVAPIDEKSRVDQWGPLLVTRKPDGKDGSIERNIDFEVRGVRDSKLLWTRKFPKDVPFFDHSDAAGTLLIGWQVDLDAAKDELKSHPALQSKLAAIHDRKNAWLLEDLDINTGKEIGALIVDTGKGSFEVESAFAAGKWVIVFDDNSRVLAYSLADGEQRWRSPARRRSSRRLLQPLPWRKRQERSISTTWPPSR
jgi:WD40 repeat protein